MPRPTAGILATVALAFVMGGCRDATAPSPDLVAGDISVASSAEGLVIVNGTGYPIHTVEMESGVLALIDMMPCDHGCEVQQPGVRRVVPWSSVIGYGSQSSDYIVYWFTVQANADGSFTSGAVHITKLNS